MYGGDLPDLSFEVSGEFIAARGLVDHFESVFAGIKPDDVLADYRKSIPRLRLLRRDLAGESLPGDSGVVAHAFLRRASQDIFQNHPQSY